MTPMILPVLLLLLVGFAIGLPATAMLVRLGRRMGAMDTPGAAGHAKILRSVPNVGGVAIYLGIALPLLAGILLLNFAPAGTIDRLAPALGPENLERARSSSPLAIALLACLTALHVMGVVDDRRPLGPWLKLGVQVGAAAVLVVGFDVRLLTLLGPVASVALTVLWIVAITNAINFMDNMDGLAGGVAAIAGALFMAAALVNAQWFIAGTLALLVGSLAGFLVFNAPPARIFMGDGGSLVIGFLLAVLTARTTFTDPGDPGFGLGGGWYGVFMPLVVLAIPLYDLVTVTTIRLRQGRSPLVGDQQHFSHRLVELGLSRRDAVLVIWGATLVTGIGGISLGRLAAWQAVLVGVQTIVVLLVIAGFERAASRREDAGPGAGRR